MAQRSSGGPSGSSQKSQSMRPVFCDPLFPAASAYLDHYLETVESVPYEVHRNFTLLREIDARTQGYVNRLEEIAKGDLTSLYRMDPTERAHRLADLQSLLETMLQYGHEKDRLAAQTYELVEQHVRKLDMDLESYDLESKEGKRPANLDKPAPLKRAVSKDSSKEKAAPKPKKPKKEPASTLVPANKDQAGQLDRALTPQKHVGTPDTASMVSTASTKAKRSKESAKRPKTENKAKDKEKAVGDSASQAGNEAIGKVSDDEQVGQVATVDQELYCTCRQPSFGEMIGCDNEECKFEWFHFQCMGLTVKPKGNWFCPDCRKKDKK